MNFCCMKSHFKKINKRYACATSFVVLQMFHSCCCQQLSLILFEVSNFLSTLYFLFISSCILLDFESFVFQTFTLKNTVIWSIKVIAKSGEKEKREWGNFETGKWKSFLECLFSRKITFSRAYTVSVCLLCWRSKNYMDFVYYIPCCNKQTYTHRIKPGWITLSLRNT